MSAPDACLPLAAVLDTDPSSRLRNSGAAGVNRVLRLGDWLLINNIGRNYELRDAREPGAAAGRIAYDETIYPGEDIPSILDIDVHAAFDYAALGLLLVYNHYGRVLAFDWPALPGWSRLSLRRELQLLGDTERVLLLHDRLLTTSPRGQHTPEPEQPGLFLSEPLAPPLEAPAAGGPDRLRYQRLLADEGLLGALAASDDGRLLAVGGRDTLMVFDLRNGLARVGEDALLWRRRPGFAPRWLRWLADGSLLAAGPAEAAADRAGDAWDALDGGVLALLSAAGETLLHSPLPRDAAWGYAAEPLALSPGGEAVFTLDRSGGLHRLDLASGGCRQVYARPAPSSGAPAASLGIGHCDWAEGALYAGFSRGGYRLLRYEMQTGCGATGTGHCA